MRKASCIGLFGLLAFVLCALSPPVSADLLKQSTAFNRTVLLVSSSDHLTGLTGQAGSVTVVASKAGAAEATITPTVTEIGHGKYKLALTSSHTDTLGDLDLYVTATGSDPADYHDQVVAFDPADAAALGLTRLDVAVSSRSTYAGGDTAGTTTLLSRIPGTVQPQTGDSYARLGAPAGASISADIAGVPSLVWSAGTRLLTGSVTVGAYASGMSPVEQILNKVIPGEGTVTVGQAIYASFLSSSGTFGTAVRATSAPWTISVPFKRSSDGTTVWTYTTTYTDSTFSKTTGRSYVTASLPSF